ncbi:hypothetical protein H8S37_04490 [Mediterraneibacter sp. NSJ-55]|uniref:Uncharacterized protein n=1 Tax=Mediterraneibacter hominis TaxID=2763054 RepID=A0A923LGA2_9FIRM|nr:hypothetical protein [Mediterraneibacter hominis]MBC5688192.1 hypothetical protein [Mediterraneibacter hominis]
MSTVTGWADMKYREEGYGITIPLSQLSQEAMYKDYSVFCQYQFNKKKNKYQLTMWIQRKDIDGHFRFEREGIDTQYISGTRETIRENICRIVEQAMNVKYFDYYINRYEYDMECYEKGFEILELKGEKPCV